MEANNSLADRLLPRSLLAGAVGLACCFAAWTVWREAFFRGYLVGYIFCVGILLGCLAIEMIYRLTGGGWGEMIHRPIEAAIQTLPLSALFFLPVVAGIDSLYPWADASEVASDPDLAHKSPYLNPHAFVSRAIVYFAIWVLLAFLLTRWSRQLDRTGDRAILRRLGILSGPGAVLFALADTVAAIDWQMSLEPHWSSTIFPVIFGISQVLAGLAFSTLAVTMLAPHPRVLMPVGKLFLQDLGSLLLAFVVFWAYVSFCSVLTHLDRQSAGRDAVVPAADSRRLALACRYSGALPICLAVLAAFVAADQARLSHARRRRRLYPADALHRRLLADHAGLFFKRRRRPVARDARGDRRCNRDRRPVCWRRFSGRRRRCRSCRSPSRCLRRRKHMADQRHDLERPADETPAPQSVDNPSTSFEPSDANIRGIFIVGHRSWHVLRGVHDRHGLAVRPVRESNGRRAGTGGGGIAQRNAIPARAATGAHSFAIRRTASRDRRQPRSPRLGRPRSADRTNHDQ